MGRKRKSRGRSGDDPVSRGKRKTTGAATLTREKNSPPISDMDEPRVHHIIKVKLEPESVPEEHNNQHQVFDDPSNLDLLPDPDIDIGDVNLMPIPKVELMEENEDDGGLASNMTTEPKTPNIDPDIREKVDAASSTSKSSEGRASPTECENDAAAPEGVENNQKNSKFSPVLQGNNSLLNEMEMTSTRITKTIAGVDENEKDVENGSILSLAIQEKNREITTLTGELLAATSRNKLLQQEADSSNVRIQKLHNKIKLLEDLVRNCAECKVLKEELEEARSGTETLQCQLHSKRVDLERQTRQIKLLEGEKRKLLQKHSRTEERLQAESKILMDYHTNIAISEKDALLERQTVEIAKFKEEITQVHTEKEHLTNYVIPKQASEIKRLQDDNADMKRLLTEKLPVIQRKTGDDSEGSQQSKILKDHSNKRKAALDAAKKLASKKSRKLKTQQEKTIRKVDLFKAWHFRDQEGNSELHLSAKRGDEESVSELIQLGADVNAKNNTEETPLIFAASSDGNVNATVTMRILKSLIEQGADVFATDREGQTFLHKFASNEYLLTPTQFKAISEYLVSKSLTSLFNIQDKDNGMTPFMLAARIMDLDVATISLLKGNGVDNHGKSSVSYAAEGNVSSETDTPTGAE